MHGDGLKGVVKGKGSQRGKANTLRYIIQKPTLNIHSMTHLRYTNPRALSNSCHGKYS